MRQVEVPQYGADSPGKLLFPEDVLKQLGKSLISGAAAAARLETHFPYHIKPPGSPVFAGTARFLSDVRYSRTDSVDILWGDFPVLRKGIALPIRPSGSRPEPSLPCAWKPPAREHAHGGLESRL